MGKIIKPDGKPATPEYKTKLKYHMNTEADEKSGVITQRLLLEGKDMMHVVKKWVMNTQEQQLQMALISMGWVPPPPPEEEENEND